MTFLEQLKKLDANATPGPWDWNNDATESEYFEQVVLRNGLRICEVNGDNARLILFLRNNTQAIIELVEAAEEPFDKYDAGSVDSYLLSIKDALKKLKGDV